MATEEFGKELDDAFADLKAKLSDEIASQNKAADEERVLQQSEQADQMAKESASIRFDDTHVVPLLREIQAKAQAAFSGLSLHGDFSRQSGDGSIKSQLSSGSAALQVAIHYTTQKIGVLVKAGPVDDFRVIGQEYLDLDGFKDSEAVASWMRPLLVEGAKELAKQSQQTPTVR